jgi:hypothetical protein
MDPRLRFSHTFGINFHLLATVAAPNLVINAESFASKPFTYACFRNVQLQQQSLNKPLRLFC